VKGFVLASEATSAIAVAIEQSIRRFAHHTGDHDFCSPEPVVVVEWAALAGDPSHRKNDKASRVAPKQAAAVAFLTTRGKHLRRVESAVNCKPGKGFREVRDAVIADGPPYGIDERRWIEGNDCGHVDERPFKIVVQVNIL
jgi:hypothetical protein